MGYIKTINFNIMYCLTYYLFCLMNKYNISKLTNSSWDSTKHTFNSYSFSRLYYVCIDIITIKKNKKCVKLNKVIIKDALF